MLMKSRVLTLSDLHLGRSSKVPTQIIIERIIKYIFPYISKTDLLTINGDIFDNAIALTKADSKLILSFFIQLMMEAERYNTTIRILRGTYSHDRTQCEHIVMLHKAYGFKHDLKYFDSLTVEYIEHLDLRMAYIPEDIPYNTDDEIVSALEVMLQQAGWKDFHFILFHGYYYHLIPNGLRTPPKRALHESKISRLLHPKGYVLGGHIHTKSIYKQMIEVGSFDRFAQGEEETKGGFYITEDGPKFIENQDATQYITIDLSKYDHEDSIEVYKKKVDKLFPKDIIGYVRVIHDSIEVKQILNKITTKEYPYLTYSSKSNTNNDELVVNELDTSSDLIPDITPENLPIIISNYLKEHNDLLLEPEEITTLIT